MVNRLFGDARPVKRRLLVAEVYPLRKFTVYNEGGENEASYYTGTIWATTVGRGQSRQGREPVPFTLGRPGNGLALRSGVVSLLFCGA
jgi:hypothetical protein